MCVYIQRLLILHINIKALCIANLYIMGKKENDDKVTYLFICSQLLPREPSQPSSSTEVKSTTKWRPSTQMPESQKSPRSLVICGRKLIPQSRPASKVNIKKTSNKSQSKRQIIKQNTARSRERKRRNTTRDQKENDRYIRISSAD